MAAVYFYPAKCIGNGRSRNARSSNPDSRRRRHRDSPRPLAPFERSLPGSCGAALKVAALPAPASQSGSCCGDAAGICRGCDLDKCSAVPANVAPSTSYGGRSGLCAASSRGWTGAPAADLQRRRPQGRPGTRRRCARAAKRWGLHMFRIFALRIEREGLVARQGVQQKVCRLGVG
jgi:hypothetical protein